ncbi:MAG: hypothetical protein ABI051_15235 [Vicinamibacterales bacterium]
MLNLVLGVLLLAQSAPAAPRTDTRTWYQAYADAQRAVEQRNWAAAVANIEAASRAGAPKPGRNVLFYGDVYRDFNPDYYLGVAYLNLGRYDDADRAFERVKQAQLVAPKDSQYAELTRLATQAKGMVSKEAAALAAAAPGAKLPDPVVPAPSITASAPMAVPNASQAAPMGLPPASAAQYSSPQAGGSSSMQSKLAQAANPKLPNRSGSNSAVAQSLGARPPDMGQPAAGEERAALIDFFSGRYVEARNRLTKLTLTGRGSQRALFYLACSRAALALTGQPDADNAIAEARVQLRQAGDLAQFAQDRPLISPRVRQALEMQP